MRGGRSLVTRRRDYPTADSCLSSRGIAQVTLPHTHTIANSLSKQRVRIPPAAADPGTAIPAKINYILMTYSRIWVAKTDFSNFRVTTGHTDWNIMLSMTTFSRLYKLATVWYVIKPKIAGSMRIWEESRCKSCICGSAFGVGSKLYHKCAFLYIFNFLNWKISC